MRSEQVPYTHFFKGTAEKIGLVAAWLVLAVSLHHWLTQLLLLMAGCLFVHFLGRKRSNKWRFLLLGAAFIVAGTIGLVFTTGQKMPQAFIQFQLLGVWWNITPFSLENAGLMVVKALNGLFAMQIAICSLTFAEGITLARRLRLPEVFIELVVLSYRYLFGVKKCANDILLAQRQRLGYSGFRIGLLSFATMLSAVFIKSMRLSLQNYQAMQVRAYHGRTYCPHHWEKSSRGRIGLIVSFVLFFVALSFIQI
ncbi:energy-coupling factor transporter transmembrane component T [Carboxylicivirga taeanensis]|uniref:energy-coupling factor transporter transmembrane component T n=1 Tax=Carboxylicivirga taeanensis TaxID=1416875 RepID=UPI003F6DC54B